MIVVVADDFTGASEIAGIAIGFGLSVRIQTVLDGIEDTCDVLVLDTNTRSLGSDAAGAAMEQIMALLKDVQVDLFFKKTDSVLRGNIQRELSVILSHHADKSVLLVPANPSKGRTIRHGVYYIDGVPINESIFSKDPEFPALVSDVTRLVDTRKEDSEVQSWPADAQTKPGIIYIPDVGSESEVRSWASLATGKMIVAGAADFFKAILSSFGYKQKNGDVYHYDFLTRRSLIVCGSSLSDLEKVKTQMYALRPRIIEMGGGLCASGNSGFIDELTNLIVDGYEDHAHVVLLVNTDLFIDEHVIQQIPRCLAEVVARVVNQVEIEELFVEGGTSSSEIVRKLGWSHFEPVQTFGHGIVRMDVHKFRQHLTVKPGSYEWPDGMWQASLSENKNT